eukprot:gene17006-18719_t
MDVKEIRNTSTDDTLIASPRTSNNAGSREIVVITDDNCERARGRTPSCATPSSPSISGGGNIVLVSIPVRLHAITLAEEQDSHDDDNNDDFEALSVAETDDRDCHDSEVHNSDSEIRNSNDVIVTIDHASHLQHGCIVQCSDDVFEEISLDEFPPPPSYDSLWLKKLQKSTTSNCSGSAPRTPEEAQPPSYNELARNRDILEDAPPDYHTLFTESINRMMDLVNDDPNDSPRNTYWECFRMLFIYLAVTGLIIIVLGLLIFLPMMMVIFGISNIHNCPIQPRIPMFLISVGVFQLLECCVRFLYQMLKKRRSQNQNHNQNRHSGYSAKDPFMYFIVVWFVVGSMWVYQNYPSCYSIEGIPVSEWKYLRYGVRGGRNSMSGNNRGKSNVKGISHLPPTITAVSTTKRLNTSFPNVRNLSIANSGFNGNRTAWQNYQQENLNHNVSIMTTAIPNTPTSTTFRPRKEENKSLCCVNSKANIRRIKNVEDCFGSSGLPLCQPGRVLVGEGVLTKICRKKPKPRKFFLFNDAICYGNIIINEKKYNKQHILPLEEVKIIGLEDDEGLRNGWQIINPTKSFAVYAATSTEKAEWMAHIQKCIDDLLAKTGKKPSKEHAAVWVPDSDANCCMHCKKSKFTAINRRHHCRRCGLVVCGNCSSRKFLLTHISSKPIRVCDTCYEKLSSGMAKPNGDLTPDEKATVEKMNSDKVASLSRKQSETMAESGSSGEERSDDEESESKIQTQPTFYEKVKGPDEPMEE